MASWWTRRSSQATRRPDFLCRGPGFRKSRWVASSFAPADSVPLLVCPTTCGFRSELTGVVCTVGGVFLIGVTLFAVTLVGVLLPLGCLCTSAVENV